MTNVFISYSKRRDLTFRLRDYLKSKGLSVWVDQDALEARGEFDGQIRAGLQQAETIVTLWTEEAIASKWVIAEATYAADGPDGPKLINVVPHPVSRGQLPERFQKYHLLVETDLRPLDMERIFDQVIKIRDGVPLPAEVPLREHFEAKYDELLLDTKRLPLPTDAAGAPSILLQAKYGVVPFIDLQGLKPALINWALGQGEGARFKPAAGRLIHGPGGLGKTRLMIEVASALREKGWSAGFLNRLEMRADDPEPDQRQKPKLREEALQQLITNSEDAGVAIVIDYAEGRTEEVKALAAQIRKAARVRPDRPLVLFLLVREIGEWWDDLRQSEPTVAAVFAAGLGQLSEVAIAEDLSTDKRRALFDAARERFADALASSPYVKPNRHAPGAAVLGRLDINSDYDRPLAVLMEALLHVYSETASGDEVGMAALLDQILNLEILHWQKVIDADEAQLRARGEISPRPPFRDHRRALQAGASQSTLVGGTSSRHETAQLLELPGPTAPLVRDLGTFYGNGRGGLTGVEPDLIGEHLVLSEAEYDLEHAYRLVKTCLAHSADGPVRWRQILTVLNRATKREHGPKSAMAEALIAKLIREYAIDLAPLLLEVAVSEPEGRLPRIIEEVAPALDEGQVDAFVDTLPKESVALANAAVSITCRQVERTRVEIVAQTTRDFGEFGHLSRLSNRLHDYGAWLGRAGRREEATKASQEGVNIKTALASAKPGTFLPDLAMSLNNFGGHLSALGRREDAVKASQQAVDIYRELAKDKPDDFLAGLARGLKNLGTDLLNLGRREDATKASQQAVDMFRVLDKSRPGVFLSDLAGSLNNLSTDLLALGRREDAVKASQQAVEIYRDLAKDKPDAFLSDLAGSLTTLGVNLSALGRHEDALKASQKAVEIHRDLAKDSPDAFLSDLATSLNNTGAILSRLGRRGDALKASQEAVEIYRDLAKDRPDAFLPDLAMSLNNTGTMLSNLGSHEQALAAAWQAVDIRRALSKDMPDTFLPDLATSLNNTGAILSYLGRHEEALTAAKQAVDIRRALSKDRPVAFLPDLATSISVASEVLAALDRPADAAAAANEALAILAPFVEQYPENFDQLSRTIGANILRYSATAGREPDDALLARVAWALDGDKAQSLQVEPTAFPDQLVDDLFVAEEAQVMLRQVMSANGLDGAPADLPMETKKVIVAMLIQNGVIQLGDGPDATERDA